MKVDKSKFICELDGYKYYLGDIIASEVSWHKAKLLVNNLGDGWELPNRHVSLIACSKFSKEMPTVGGWCWLSEEISHNLAWIQYFSENEQTHCNKEYGDIDSYVIPVYKEKSKEEYPKIKLLRIMGFSDLVLDIDGKKVLYKLGNHPIIDEGWSLSTVLDISNRWEYEVVHEDFVEWLSQQQESKNTTSDFKKVFHIREKNKDGEVLARGGATVVFVENNAGFAAHIALCHPEDNYNKKVGVEVALSKDCYFKTTEVSDKFIGGTTPSYWRKVVKAV